nr:hypothetical protein [uncultured Methanospirillum sp.]
MILTIPFTSSPLIRNVGVVQVFLPVRGRSPSTDDAGLKNSTRSISLAASLLAPHPDEDSTSYPAQGPR